MEKDGIIGMYHEKMGIIEDFEGNKVVFLVLWMNLQQQCLLIMKQ